MGVEVFHHLKRVLSKRGYGTAVGDEGGFAPDLKSNEEALEVILEAAAQAGFSPGEDLLIALDPASSEFYHEGRYCFRKSDGSEKSAEQMVEFWENWVRQYPIASIEDGLAEDDWEGWALLTERLGAKVQLVGDDLFVTNTRRLQRGHPQPGRQLHPGQGEPDRYPDRNHRSRRAGQDPPLFGRHLPHAPGETEDTFIADLAVGLNTGQIKTGSASRTDRIAKYNQLLRIEEDLGAEALFRGKSFRQG